MKKLDDCLSKLILLPFSWQKGGEDSKVRGFFLLEFFLPLDSLSPRIL